ncbi:GntR family transcriptional regulator [Modestobacter sp. VKM Ac-2977]|uniref:GntR family transcriptional regulator n=1 Tax=Modestobacter sp. VKM Ac-2977 TaxID=3004131 RepID=UPI0022AAF773|nr:GntR family transcriptional regulator [Modestobacter sp. VKM Ac-2977]MCZ2821346.1 GntR family transcriptional regulator [Modestobacter sp. VKM Ac-2977]
MDITVDVTSPTPPYEQIRAQVATFIHGGLLLDGARLPTIRALAADLGVAVGTVARAYRELEATGLVASRRRTGTVVTSPPAVPPLPDDVRQAAAELAERAVRAGLDDGTTVAVLRSALVAAMRSRT